MEIMKEKVSTVFSDLQGRVRNPIVLSFILVWLYFHWKLVYSFLTLDTSLPFQMRVDFLSSYVKKATWYGMVGVPLLWAFVSLVAYYLLAIVSQGVRVLIGKRLNAYFLSKLDTGSFVLKTEHSELKKRNVSLQREIDNTKDSLSRLLNEKQQIEHEAEQLRNRLYNSENKRQKAESNIRSHEFLQDNFQLTILKLLASYGGLEKVNFNRSEILADQFGILKGNWNITSNPVWSKNSGGSFEEILIKGSEYIRPLTNEVGEITDLEFDRGYSILSFTVKYKAESKTDRKYLLIKLHDDEFIGFKDNEFVSWKRKT
jgi:hypothetical protein